MAYHGRDRPGEMWEMWRNGLEEDSGAEFGEAGGVIGGAPRSPRHPPSQSEELRGLSASVEAAFLTEGEMHLAAESVETGLSFTPSLPRFFQESRA